MAEHSKKITLSDIAQKLGISKSAVSFALKNSPMVSKETCKRVQGVAQKMGYKRNELFSSMMSSMRKGSRASFTENIAVINGNLESSALTTHPTLPRYYEGIRQEAERLGYGINEFWLHEKGLNAEKLTKIFNSRGIRGGIVLGHSFGNLFPKRFERLWRDFYFISAGIRTINPYIEVVASDDYAISYNAYFEVSALGYKRIGIVFDENVDELVGGTMIAGYLRAQLKCKMDIPPFMESPNNADYAVKLKTWIDKYKPDAILYLRNAARKYLEKISEIKDGKIVLFQLERRGDSQHWTGMEQNNDIVGRVAVRRLADMLSRNSTVAGENSSMLTLVPPTWISDGVRK